MIPQSSVTVEAPIFSPPTDDYDWEVDAKGCWLLAIQVIGERVRAGAAVPEFLLSEAK